MHTSILIFFFQLEISDNLKVIVVHTCFYELSDPLLPPLPTGAVGVLVYEYTCYAKCIRFDLPAWLRWKKFRVAKSALLRDASQALKVHFESM